MKVSLILLLALLTSSACVELPTKSTPKTPIIEQAKPRTIEADPIKDLYGRRVVSFIMPNQEATAYLNRLLSQIKKASPTPDLQAEVFITAERGLVAETTEAGNIFISRGWLETADNEDELLALLAHEFGHIALNHHGLDWASKAQKQAQVYSALLMAASNMLAKTGGNSALNNQQMSNLKKQEILIQLAESFLFPAWNRSQELDADRFAIDTLVRLKRSPRGLNAFFDHIDDWEKKSKPSLELTTDEILNLPLDVVAMRALQGFKSDNHPPAEARAAAIDDYKEQFYSGLKRIKPDIGGLATLRKNNSYITTIKSYQLIDEAEDAFAQTRKKTALQLGGQADSLASGNHPYVQYKLIKIHLGSGNAQQASAVMRRMQKSSEPSWKAYQLMLDCSSMSNQEKEKLLEGGYQQFKQAPVINVKRISFYASRGNKDAANKIMNDCLLHNTEYRDQCIREANMPSMPLCN